MPTLIRWWEALRASEVAKLQQKYRVDWDATDGRNGGAQQIVWENSDGDGKIKWDRRKEGCSRSGSCFGSGPGKGLRACQPPCGLGLGDAFQLPEEDLASAVWLLRAPEAGYSSKDV